MRSIEQRCLAVLLLLCAWAASAPSQDGPTTPRWLRPLAGDGDGIVGGSLEVFEDRDRGAGRKIPLYVVVLRARSEKPKPDPVFFLAGGPGQGAASMARSFVGSWMREERDIVLVDQRGTGRSNPLRVPLPGNDDNVQGYLEPIFDAESFARALPALRARADLSKYTTPIAMDDLDEVRAALGYDKINLVGGSYGSRAALVYMRRHEEHVRCAILTGIAPIAFTNPLYHASAAQHAFDALADECRRDPRYRDVYGDLDGILAGILKRLEAEPARVTVSHPGDGTEVEVLLSRDAFCEALRVMLYYTPTARRVPALLVAAQAGDYRPFAEAGLRSNRGLRNSLAFGMLMSVVGSEDIPRIAPDAIERETAGTFLGDGRVRRQMAVAALWPTGDVPADYGEPVRVATPVLLFSGHADAVTPPRWGQEAARHLKNSVHVVVPGGHEGKNDPCGLAITKRFLQTADPTALDLNCVKQIRLPPIPLPR